MLPLNPDVGFALSSAPGGVQPALAALWGLDEALGRVLATGREPMISRIRLAWWREALERLDREPPPKEPVLEAVAAQLLPRGISGAALADMEDGWNAMLSQEPLTPAELQTYAERRGALLFRCSAQLLGCSEQSLDAAGSAWVLVDLARHSTEASDVTAALEAARALVLPRRWPKPLRPLGMLAVLAARDLERGSERWEEPGAPPRTARMLRHRLLGW